MALVSLLEPALEVQATLTTLDSLCAHIGLSDEADFVDDRNLGQDHRSSNEALGLA